MTTLLFPIVAITLAIPRLALAPLLFEAYKDGRGGQILLIRDCGAGEFPEDSACQEWQEGFSGARVYQTTDKRQYRYAGDAAILSRLLQNNRYREIWLYSGGGLLTEGVAIGRLLRQYGTTVRVPNAARIRTVRAYSDSASTVYCASSCTVAFMGGLFRYLDPGSVYLVHSASSVASGLSRGLVQEIVAGRIDAVVADQYRYARASGLQLLTHFQNTLLKMAGRPTRNENDSAFERWGRTLPRPPPYDAEQRRRDYERLASEGNAAAQDVMMRIERDAMGWAIEDLRQVLDQLGPRAGPALRMVEAMYDVSIKETASLSRETMLRMGYLTQELEPSHP